LRNGLFPLQQGTFVTRLRWGIHLVCTPHLLSSLEIFSSKSRIRLSRNISLYIYGLKLFNP